MKFAPQKTVLNLEKAFGTTDNADHTDFQRFRKKSAFILWVKEKTEVHFHKLLHPWYLCYPWLKMIFPYSNFSLPKPASNTHPRVCCRQNLMPVIGGRKADQGSVSWLNQNKGALFFATSGPKF